MNWIILEAFTGTVYPAFWWIVLFFSGITLAYSLLLTWGEKKRPMNFFTCFTAGKVMKFMATIGLMLVCMLKDQENQAQYLITIGVLFLITLVVDTALVLRFARYLKSKRYETN